MTTPNLAIALLGAMLLLLLAVAAIISLARSVWRLEREVSSQDELLDAKDTQIRLLHEQLALINGRDEHLQQLISEYITSRPRVRPTPAGYKQTVAAQQWRLN